MFGKILRAGKGGHGLRYKIDLQVIQLENLPTSIKKCRVVWARSAKLQITDTKDVRGSVASFKQNLTQVTTIYRDKTGRYEPKEYEFKVQVPGKSSSDSPITVGKATLDMAKYCKEETTTQPAMVPITFKIGSSTTGYLKLSVTTVFLGDSNEDGLTEVSGLTGLTSDHGSVREQDLEGFGDDEHAKFSKKAKSSRRDDGASSTAGPSGRTGGSRSEAARRHKPLPPTAEEDGSDIEEEPARITAKAGRSKPAAARSAEIEETEDGTTNPFAKRISKPPSRRVPPKVWEDDEDVSPLNSDDSDSEPPKPAVKAKAAKAQEPQESLDNMKASLFSSNKSAASSAARGAAGSVAVATTSASAASSKSIGSKASKPSAPAPPPAEDDDDESLRHDLFSAKRKSTGASSKANAAAAESVVASAAANAAELASVKQQRPKSAAAPPPSRRRAEDDDDDETDEEDDYGPSTSAAAPAAAAPKSRLRAAEPPEAPMAKGPSSMARAGSLKPDASKSATELEQSRQRVELLEKQLVDEKLAKDDLNKKLQNYADKVADLEDQLAEGDVTELYTQMRDMEAKHQAEIKEMEAKYQAEIKELMERHLMEVAELDDRHQAEIKELQLMASSSGRGGGASFDELKRLEAELAEQEALLRSRTAKLEAERAAANAARQSAEAKLADANKMIDDSLLVATKHQQENKVLHEEIARLKRQVEDASNWDNGAAVVAATAATNNGRRSSEDEAELEELREKVEELQEENARLKKLNETAQGAVESMLADIRAVLHDGQGGGSFWRSSESSLLDQLAVDVRRLCGVYARQSYELRNAQDRLADFSQQAAIASTRTSASGEPGSLDGTGFFTAAAGTSAKVKPHELLSRVQQLTAERDSLQDKLTSQRQAHMDLADKQAELAASLQLVEELRQQVHTLTFEKEAVERFKVATIAELRRQNDELRSSLRSLSSTAPSPRVGAHVPPMGTPQLPGDMCEAFVGSASVRHASSAAGEGDDEGNNWLEFESLVAQLKADRAELKRQVEQLKIEKASLDRQVEDLRSGGGALIAAAAGGAGAERAGHQPSGRRVAELESECANLQAEVARLQAQLAELAEADAIIKEWSDYADGLVADKTRLEQQVQELTQRLGTDSLASDVRAADAERRMTDWQRRASDAELIASELGDRTVELEQRAADAAFRAEELERQVAAAVARALGAERRADAAEKRAEDAESRAFAPEVAPVTAAAGAVASAAASPMWTPQQQPADTAEVLELRREIARLETSLSLLRTQLVETHSPAVSPGPERTSNGIARHDLNDRYSDKDALRDAARSHSEDEEAESDDERSVKASGIASVGSGQMKRGWHAELEKLRSRNAALKAAMAGLQASLEVASQQTADDGDAYVSSRKADRETQDLQSRLALALQEKAELESTVVLLRAELESVPLVPHEPGASASDGEADFAESSYTKAGEGAQAMAEVAELQRQVETLEEELAQLQKERSDLREASNELRQEIQLLEDEKDDSVRTIRRLRSEMEELAEALEVSNSENERLSLEVLTLRDQLEQLEGGAEGSASRNQSMRSSGSSARPSSHESGGSVLLQRSHAAQMDAGREFASLRAAAHDLIRQVKTGGHDGFSEESSAFGGLRDDEDLVQALKELQGHISELQRQSQQRLAPPCRTSPNAAAASSAESQLAKATARIDELQQLLEDAEIENQHLTEQLEECLTAGRKGPDSVGSVAEECQSSYGGSVAAATTGTSNPYSYGHANTLTLSALEQRLAMAEGQRDELNASLVEANATNRRLEAELAAMRQGQDASISDGLERSFSQVSTRGRASRAVSDAEDKKRLDELQAANRKLEAVCDDLEEKAQAAQERAEQLQEELEAANQKLRDLEAAAAAAAAATASTAAMQKRMEDELGSAGSRQSKEKVLDLEARVARLSREKATLEDQLEEERATRKELEETLKDKLDRAGDDEAAETVAAFEVKYNRLKERYKMLEESSQEELDELQDQLTEALSKVAELQRQVKQLQSQAAQSIRASAASGTSAVGGANLEELKSLRSENERLVQQLVSKTMQLAELNESEITIRRELARMHEVNMKLAQKATTLEAQAAMAQAAAGGKGRGRK